VPKDIFTERRIFDHVRDARPYVPYETIDDIFRADPLYRSLRGHELTDLKKTVKAGPGWVMTRHPLPGDEPIFAELRPDNPVPQGPTIHTHSAPPHVDEGDRDYLHTHSEDDTVKSEHDTAREVCYVRHVHENEKKYTFPIGEGRAARLDVHPLALEMFESGVERAFLELEGVLKADSLLSAGETAASVPGVTLWYGAAEETAALADQYLRGRRLFVMTDSDWNNPNVVFNGLLCTQTLQLAGVDAWPVVPPMVNGDPKTGVDDYLFSSNGDVEGLWVVNLLLPEGFKDWVEDQLSGRGRGRWREGMEHAITVLQWLILHSSTRGDVLASSPAIARHTGLERRTVNRSLDRLADIGVIKLVQPARRRRRPSWLKGGGEWSVLPARYAITVPSLRADMQFTRLGGFRR
jgi:hypothetical protein